MSNMQQEGTNNLLTKCGTTCELVDGSLGHAVRQYTRKLQHDKTLRVQNIIQLKKKKHAAEYSQISAHSHWTR